MASINVDKSVMPLADLLQWVELNNKSRTIQVNNSGVILIDTITWSDGSFLFTQDEILSNILHGPIRLNTTELIYNVFKIIDDINLGFRKEKV